MRIATLVMAALLLLGSSCQGDKPKPIPPPEPPPAIDTRVGFDFLAIQSPQVDCEAFLDSIQDVQVIHFGWLANTFGNETECLQRVLRDERTRSFRVHMANTVCVRNGSRAPCGPYELLYGETPGSYEWKLNSHNGELFNKWDAYAQRIATMIKTILGESWSGRECIVSPHLEVDVSPNAASQVIPILAQHFPGCTFAFNPNYQTNDRGGHHHMETHHDLGSPGVPFMASLDGVVCEFEGVPRHGYPRQWPVSFCNQWLGQMERSGSHITYVWDIQYNGIKGSFVDPRARPMDESSAFPALAKFVTDRQ